jgi:hypothetical protein
MARSTSGVIVFPFHISDRVDLCAHEGVDPAREGVRACVCVRLVVDRPENCHDLANHRVPNGCSEGSAVACLSAGLTLSAQAEIEQARNLGSAKFGEPRLVLEQLL